MKHNLFFIASYIQLLTKSKPRKMSDIQGVSRELTKSIGLLHSPKSIPDLLSRLKSSLMLPIPGKVQAKGMPRDAF